MSVPFTTLNWCDLCQNLGTLPRTQDCVPPRQSQRSAADHLQFELCQAKTAIGEDQLEAPTNSAEKAAAHIQKRSLKFLPCLLPFQPRELFQEPACASCIRCVQKRVWQCIYAPLRS